MNIQISADEHYIKIALHINYMLDEILIMYMTTEAIEEHIQLKVYSVTIDTS